MSLSRTRALMALGAIWAVAASLILGVRSIAPSARTLLAFLEKSEIESRSPEERMHLVAALSERLNRLTLEQRIQVRHRGVFLRVFRGLTSAEKEEFLARTLPLYMAAVMEGASRLPPAERADFLSRIITDGAHVLDSNGERVDGAKVKRIMEEGVTSYLFTATPSERRGMEPLIEQMRGYTRW